MRCEQCNKEFVLYVGRQRFCCRACSDAWFNEERREAVKWFREQRQQEVERTRAPKNR
jgi:hypothetical protein